MKEGTSRLQFDLRSINAFYLVCARTLTLSKNLWETCGETHTAILLI